MGEVHTLRLSPLIRVEKWNAGWMVTVRPCPLEVQSLRNFDTEARAAEYAASLQREHGFRVRPDRYAVPSPGEAA